MATTCPKRGHVRLPAFGIEWLEDGEGNTPTLVDLFI